MTKTSKAIIAVTGTLVLLIVVAIIIIATFDWNRLKPTINQKVSTELNRPFAIRGDLGVVWDGHEGDAGATFTVGDDADMMACAQACKNIYDDVEAHWRTTQCSGQALYEDRKSVV